jgi:RNA polymerase sigma-70 factor (ECF subfamily)
MLTFQRRSMVAIISPPLTERVVADEVLAQQARQNPDAFAELYRRHVDRVYGFHLARTGSPHDAQDLTAETFIAALQGLTRYRELGSFAAWLLGIARHKMVSHFRGRKPESPLEDAFELPDPAPLPEALADRRIEMAQVSRALQKLVPERSEAILLCVFAGLTAREAGQVMGKSQAAVKMLVYRGLGDLRQSLTLDQQEEK